MDVHTAKVLEFDKIKDIVLTYAKTPLGAQQARDIDPARETDTVKKRLTLSVEYLKAYRDGFRLPIRGESPDPSPIIETLKTKGRRLKGKELLTVLWICELASRLGKIAETGLEQWSGLKTLVRTIPDLDDLRVMISQTIEPSGLIRDDASELLSSLRHQMRTTRERIHSALEAIIGSSAAVQDEVIVQRDGRYVVPIRAGSQGLVKGVIHGQSSSGQSVFVEPITIIDLNNRLRLLLDEEQEEVYRILAELTEEIQYSLPEIEKTGEVIGKLDLLEAYSCFAEASKGAIPKVDDKGFMSLKEARHPLLCAGLAKRIKRPSGGKKVVPSSLTLDADTRMMIVSGPNAGGKTVLLKTVGLIQLMFQSGIPVPVHPDTTLPVFRTIQADIGDQQDMASSLSTFTAHLMTLGNIIEHHESPSLILLDELGGRTDPAEGSALGMAIADHFLKQNAFVMITTHSEPLKVFAATTPGAINAAMEFDDGPTYRIIVGIPGSSNAFSIASDIGFPSAILGRARELRGETEAMVGQYVAELQETMSELESAKRRVTERLNQAEVERQSYVKRREALDLEKKQILA
ncbi:hypothetical protein ACFLU6_03430, partial [Acidobacteriota bacterium]